MRIPWSLQGFSQPAVTDVVVSYFAFECGLRGLAPQSIVGVYLPGIVNLFNFNHMQSAPLIRLAASSPPVLMVASGFKRLYHQIHPASSSIKLAFTASSAHHSHGLLLSGAISSGLSPSLSDDFRVLGCFRVLAAMLFGIFFLLRKSEFLYKAGKTSPPLRSSVVFLADDKSIIPHHLVGIIPARWLLFNVGQSKTDQFSEGRVNLHEAQPSGGCIVSVMESYFRASFLRGALPSDSLFDVPGLPTLSSTSISRIMKDTATSLGLPPTRVSTHSLRYGGATMLAAAGFPEYIIAMYGGWKEGSTSLRQYTRPSLLLVGSVSRHMFRMQSINVEEDFFAIAIARAVQACT